MFSDQLIKWKSNLSIFSINTSNPNSPCSVENSMSSKKRLRFSNKCTFNLPPIYPSLPTLSDSVIRKFIEFPWMLNMIKFKKWSEILNKMPWRNREKGLIIVHPSPSNHTWISSKKNISPSNEASWSMSMEKMLILKIA